MKTQTMILLAGLLALPACGTEGLKEAQAQATEEPQPIPDQDDADLQSDSVPTPIPALKEPERAAAPAPTAVRLTVPAATQIEVEFTTQVSSETSHAGDSFSARLAKDLMIENRVAVPAGAELTGTVTEAVATKKIGGQARLALAFETLSLASGQSTALAATLVTEGKKQTAKDVATIGGSTAGGALLGRVLAGDKQKGTAIGAVVGAAAGTAVAANNKSDPVTIPEGAIVPVTLQQSIVVVLEGRNRRFQR